MTPRSFLRRLRISAFGVTTFGALLANSPNAQSAKVDGAAPARQKSHRSDKFFADRTVRLFQIELPDSAMQALRRAPRSYVSGTVREGEQVFTNAGVHLKGMGSFQPLDTKPSFVVKFDKFAPGKEYCGLTKLMLNNSLQDQTYLSELLATRLFRDAGVPAARVTHTRVTLNGRDLGLYVAIEAMNKQFLKRHFTNTQGNLYEGYLTDIDRWLDQDNGQDTSQADVGRLRATCAIAEPAERFQQLDKVLDVERFASFAAMEMLLTHWDGYTLHTNNYRFYHDPSSDKITFIAHGLDSVFRRPGMSIEPPMRSVVSRALFQTPQGVRLYQQRLRTLYTNVFRLEVLTNRMEEALSKLRACSLSSEQLSGIERRASLMRERIVRRVARVGAALSGVEMSPVRFDQAGFAPVGDWREEFDHGEPSLDQVSEGGALILHIKAAGGRCRASWRAMIYLRPGRYRFEGRVRTDGVNGGGAGLRISGATRNQRIGGVTPWRNLGHEFEVLEGAGDVELVCEFDAFTGEAWFDSTSLGVRKL